MRAKDLISQILIFSRRTEGKLGICDLRSVLKEGLKLIRATLPATIVIRELISEKVSLIKADATQMYQLLMNLTVNAGHAMPDGGVLEISLNNVEGDQAVGYIGNALSKPCVRLAVTDTGVGMDEKVLSHIFDPFFTTKEVGKGTGIGLSMVYGIVQQHGGEIFVSTQPGKGSTFEILIPANQGPSEVGTPSDSQYHDYKGRESILFIDDEESISIIGQEILAGMGYRVTAMTRSTEALELFQNDPNHFDLVITDQTMPDMTGVMLCQKLRKIKPDIPIIMCTGYSEKVTPEVLEELGIAELVYKPLKPKEMGQIVRMVLDKDK